MFEAEEVNRVQDNQTLTPRRTDGDTRAPMNVNNLSKVWWWRLQ
jgi:hypothetical protein